MGGLRITMYVERGESHTHLNMQLHTHVRMHTKFSWGGYWGRNFAVCNVSHFQASRYHGMVSSSEVTTLQKHHGQNRDNPSK